ncbi:4-hydroxybenzoate octaprenyltransferase [Holospora obtusa F1]|uniref:4-hydroxybenzoate octaprenyltransferase n=1 Tax=Holospora obtusa F1 TaxID=1399147 RepID=W6TSK7_HOLOB|nr:UbiA family prenyltransferase [Holospora obtusa]ETZ06792.1 4-hydroxybenzoate octaprenyltransferase [Holospora obtusa F1]
MSFMKVDWRLWFQAARFGRIEGALLLFWPSFWGYTYGVQENIKFWVVVWLLGGALWMRSVGCVYNDWVDAPFDHFVPRTQRRPLIFRSDGWQIPMFTICVCCSLLALWLLPFNVVVLGALGWGVSMGYPWLKRYIIPQIALGLLFGWGVWIGAELSRLSNLSSCWGIYSIAVLWSIEYDTVYSAPDQWADRKLGLKSIACYAGRSTRSVILGICMLRWGIMGILSYSSKKSLILMVLSANITYYSLQKVRLSKASSCLHYMLLQAWVQGGILALWAYFLNPFR